MFGRRHRVKSTSDFGCGHSPTWTSYPSPFWHHQGMISRTRLKKNEIKGAVFCIFLSSPSTVQLEMMRTWWERFSSESAAFTAWASEREKELEAVSATSSLEPLDKHIRTVEVRTACTPVLQENAESARYFHKVFLLSVVPHFSFAPSASKLLSETVSVWPEGCGD